MPHSDLELARVAKAADSVSTRAMGSYRQLEAVDRPLPGQVADIAS